MLEFKLLDLLFAASSAIFDGQIKDLTRLELTHNLYL
jgi:hypothetical protein